MYHKGLRAEGARLQRRPLSIRAGDKARPLLPQLWHSGRETRPLSEGPSGSGSLHPKG